MVWIRRNGGCSCWVVLIALLDWNWLKSVHPFSTGGMVRGGHHALLTIPKPLIRSSSIALRLHMKKDASIERLGLQPPAYLLHSLQQGPPVPSSRLVSVADVVTSTGKPFHIVQRDLLALAVSTGAGMQVTKDGELFFCFPRNVEAVLSQRSLRFRLTQSYAVLAPYVQSVIRASYGVGLITSLLIVTMAISSLSSAKHDEEDSERRKSNNKGHRRRHSQRHTGMSMNVYIDLNSVFNSIFAKHPHSQHQGGMNLLDACYSFLFGDADPNQDFDTKLSRSVAQFIRQQRGVVIAEQLAAFIPSPPALINSSPAAVMTTTQLDSAGSTAGSMDTQSVTVDESWVLPTLLRYRGRPAVTKEGHIVYIFDELLLSASNDKSEDGIIHRTASPELLLEEEVQFSQAHSSQLSKVVLLAAANLVGVVALARLLSQASLVRSKHRQLVLVLRKIFPALAVYATGFLVFPLIRYFDMKKKNKEIRRRNALRRKWFELMVVAMSAPQSQSKSAAEQESLVDKLRSRDAYFLHSGKSTAALRETEVVYDTQKSIEQQEEAEAKWSSSRL